MIQSVFNPFFPVRLRMTGIATYSVAQCHAVAGRTAAAVQAATEARKLFSQTWDRRGPRMLPGVVFFLMFVDFFCGSCEHLTLQI